MTFAIEAGCYQYTIMPFGLKNSPAIFSKVIVAAFKEYIHKFIEVYFDDWTVFRFLKDHVGSLRLMLNRCRQYQISLNLKKCIFGVPFGILLGHIVCKQGLIVDPVKIVIIVNLSCQIDKDNIGTHRLLPKVHKGYAQITTPLEKLFKKDTKYKWTEEWQHSFDILKEKMVTASILVFPNWKKEFHIHVNASSVALGIILAQQGEGDLDHPISFSSIKLSTAENNYTTTEQEGLAMVYALKNLDTTC